MTVKAKGQIQLEINYGRYWSIMAAIGQLWPLLVNYGRYWSIMAAIGQLWPLFYSWVKARQFDWRRCRLAGVFKTGFLLNRKN